ncbi:MAG: tRNA (adenosine(37)-N6)-threonylcarbamoyltransferase complex ATPase subunit type 1 TsaE [Phycisphaerales bacterium]|nr:tRNA (adenosine(37)-N6)-threonylcarbamoyltransferase complex ATPase subunit type 1 TsaE [Phycisphaerales bacterium]
MGVIYRSRSIAQTESIAADLASTLRGGTCIALEGDLGAGKTQFVRGLVRGLGATDRVTSPTFVLLNIYGTGRLTVYHLDAYRVHGTDDFQTIGFSELLEQNGVVVVEWASRVKSLLPPDTIDIQLTALSPRIREIRITPRA